MTRQIQQPDKSYRTMTITQSFSINEARQAFASNWEKKDNWKNFPKQMTLNRAISFCARAIAADVVNGMYETSELLDTTDVNYTINPDNGKVTVVNEVKTESKVDSSTMQDAVIVSEESNTASKDTNSSK